jgi:hypothetical protein
MTDPRPRPQYGEYAPIDTAAPAPENKGHETGEPVVPPAPLVDPPRAAVTRKTRDLIITTALLIVAVWDVATGFAQYGNLAALLQQTYDQLGIGEFTSIELALSMGGVINGGRILIVIAVIALSLWRISRGRTAFWIPLAGAVASGIFVTVCSVIVMANDPAFIAFSQGVGAA